MSGCFEHGNETLDSIREKVNLSLCLTEHQAMKIQNEIKPKNKPNV
jgi:hypothetical protein